MLRGIAAQHGLSGQHLGQATQTSHQRDFARLAVFVGLRASQFGQQLHFSPVESDPYLVKKAGCHPSQGDEALHGLPIEHLHLFPAQTLFGDFETVLIKAAVGDPGDRLARL